MTDHPFRRHLCVLLLVFGLPLALSAQQAGQPRPAGDAITTADDSLLMGRERAQWEALKTRDTTAFAKLMGGDVVDIDLSGIKRTTPAATARYVTGCQTVSYVLTDSHVAHYTTTAVVTYKAAVEQTCWGQKAPSPIYVMTVYERRAGSWAPIAHSETAATHWPGQ